MSQDRHAILQPKNNRLSIKVTMFLKIATFKTHFLKVNFTPLELGRLMIRVFMRTTALSYDPEGKIHVLKKLKSD